MKKSESRSTECGAWLLATPTGGRAIRNRPSVARLESAGAGPSPSGASIADRVNRLAAEQRDAQGSFKRRQAFAESVVKGNPPVGLHVDAVAGHNLEVRGRIAALRDAAPIHRQLTITAIFTAPRHPDVLLRRYRGQAVDLAKCIEHRLIAGERNAVDLLAVAAAIGDDVIDLAVIGQHVDVEILELRRRSHFAKPDHQLLVDGFLDLVERQAADQD